mgnify:CR=1 FL=1
MVFLGILNIDPFELATFWVIFENFTVAEFLEYILGYFYNIFWDI